jgi:serine/threonine-protein kinase
VEGDSPPKRGIPQHARGPVRIGPYLLQSRIAVGGTAEVYLAQAPGGRGPARAGEPLIVKRLLPHFLSDPEGLTMFEREAALHAAVRHENVVSVFESGVSDTGEPYLAMEYVDGVDGYRLLRRLRHEGRACPTPVAIHVVREVLKALDCVHNAYDSSGSPLGIIHRDVTPSNIYLSREGRAKLGDFGIARSTSRATMRNAASAMLKGKIAYLAPEQVAGEEFDHRADLFSVASVLAEMLLGKPLFPGAGQLAILLAIRDCKIDPLREIEGSLPTGMFLVLEKALARDPVARYQTAAAFAAALSPFEPDPESARRELAALVQHTQATSSSDALQAVHDSARALRAMTPSQPHKPFDAAAQPTARIEGLPSHVRTSRGDELGPWSFARLVEALATGEIGHGDEVAYMGQPMRSIDDVEELARFLPPLTATTREVAGPGTPDFLDDLAATSMLDVLLRILERRETGVLFAERSDKPGKKELYFRAGKLHHVASSDASELLGSYLVRRGQLAREELDLALAVLPRYSGRIGDTLIALGLVSPMDIFRAIREQGRDRVADLFTWSQGSVVFYRGQAEPHVEFPLDLDLPPLIIAGLEAAQPGEAPVETFRTRLDQVVMRGAVDREGIARGVAWPPLVAEVLKLGSVGLPLRDMLRRMVASGSDATDVLRALEVLLAGRLLSLRPLIVER